MKAAPWELVVVTSVLAMAGAAATETAPSADAAAAAPAALDIVRPRDRVVIQRNARNQGSVPVECAPSAGAKKVEVRVLDRRDERVARDWAVVKPGMHVLLPAGWYRFEFRSPAEGTAVATGTVEHVGVGEVFVTCGQSNSANHGKPPQKATDDRVCSCNFQSGRWRHCDDPQPGATGTGGSPWPLLGDRLVKEYDAPVGFICVGVGGSTVEEWVKAHYPRLQKAVMLPGPGGVRAVLWHQGESDSIARTTTDTYAARLRRVIERSRADAGWQVPWGVALASFHPRTKELPAVQAAIIAGQRAVIATVPGVFAGPATDDFQARGWLADAVHFNEQGLATHAEGWADALAPVINPKGRRRRE